MVREYRRRILRPSVPEYLERTLRGLLPNMPGVTIETIGSDHDHVPLVMEIPSTYAISAVMAELKSRSASQLRKKFPWLAKAY